MTAGSFPRLADLVGSWRARGEFFFLGKFLDESRGAGSSPAPATVAAPRTSRLRANMERLAVLLGFAWTLVRCLLAPKGRTLVFNHSSRVRHAGEGTRPLYLSPAFDLSRLVVFEDAPVPLEYAKPVLRLDATRVNRMAEIAAAVLTRVCKARIGVADRDIVGFVTRRALWRLVFRLLAPSGIRLFVWYGKEAVVSAAKSLGIEVADVQHGIIYPTHPLYNLEQSQGVAGSEFLLPDACLVYGEYWRGLLVRAGWDPARVRVLGYFLDTAPARPVRVGQPYIVYTSQPHTSGIIMRHIRSILPVCQARGWKVLVAPHPAEVGGLYKDILSDTVMLAANDSYDLLRDCQVHLSVSSTLLWEAMVFGKSSYVLEFGREATDLLGDLLAFGFGRPIADGEFPEPFTLPASPSRNEFFRDTIDCAAFECRKREH